VVGVRLGVESVAIGAAEDRSQPHARLGILIDIKHEFLAATDGLQAH
jgi:hypothetical protein